MRQAALAELAEPGLGAGFQQAELSRRQIHLAADMLGGLLVKIEANQDFAFALAHRGENPKGDVAVLSPNDTTLGVGAAVEQRSAEIQLAPVAPLLSRRVDVAGDLPSDDGPDITHEAFRLAQVAILDRLSNDQEEIVNLIGEVLRAELAPEVEPDSVGEYPV